MAFCSTCGAQIPDGTITCAACAGRAAAAGAPAAATASAGGLTDNVAGMLAYITIIPAIIFLGHPAAQSQRWPDVQAPLHRRPCREASQRDVVR